MIYTALNIAAYVIEKYKQQHKGISNLKLQKVLYYIQIKSLQDLSRAAFDDEIEAWRHGPVIRKVYYTFYRYLSDNIDYSDQKVNENYVSIDDKLSYIIDYVIVHTIDFDAWDLVKRTQATSPWKQCYRKTYCNVIDVTKLHSGDINI